MLQNITIILTDTEVLLLQYILSTYTAENAIYLRSLIADPVARDTFASEYKKRFHYHNDVEVIYIRAESIAYFLKKRIEEQNNHDS